MTQIENITNFYIKKEREFTFIPRIINPVKITRVVILSADDQIRNSKNVLKEHMPWIEVDILSDPGSASNYHSDEASVFLFDDTALTFVDTKKICLNNKDAVIVLLSSNPFIHCSPPSVAEERYPYTSRAHLIFAVNKKEFAPHIIVAAVVRCAEDKLNIEKYSRERRFVFLIVDDEPRWFSQFLPLLYNIIGQRADVMMTRTFEETLDFIFGVSNESEIDDRTFHTKGHGDDVVCVITDIYFPKGSNLDGEAGRGLVRLIKQYYPRIPVIIASKAKEAEDMKTTSFILPKGDPGSLELMKEYIQDHTGMGDFILRNKTDEVFYRIHHIQELYGILKEAKKNTDHGKQLRVLLEYYGKRDYFSTWLYMHGFRELGDKLRPRQDRGHRLVTVLTRHLQREIIRMRFTPLIIDDIRVFTLDDLLTLLRTIDPGKIQAFSDNDIFSTWLDRKCYPELAEELRPIHGSGAKLEKTIVGVVVKWKRIYDKNRPGKSK
jgi:hypothetical protein